MDYRTMKFTIEKDDRLINFLKNIGISNRKIKDLSINKLIKRDQQSLKYKDKIYKEDVIELIIENENIDYEPIEGALDIVYENEEILVIYKDRGITVNSQDQESLANHLAQYFLDSNIKSKVRFVNRIDYNTRGLVLIAKSSIIHGFLQNKFTDISREYIGIVKGNLAGEDILKFNLKKDGFKQVVSFDGKESITRYKSIYNSNDFSIIHFTLVTGRNHQIRASMSEIGHPLIGDSLYNGKDDFDDYFLLSYKLSVPDIYRNDNIEVEIDYKEKIREYIKKYIGGEYEI